MVRRTVPEWPTAVPVSASTKETPYRSLGVPLACCLQVSPPSVVRRITPWNPTAVPLSAVHKGDLVEPNRGPAGLGHPRFPAVCSVQDGAKEAHRRTGVGVYEGDPAKIIGGPAGLDHPGSPAVYGANDSASVTDRDVGRRV